MKEKLKKRWSPCATSTKKQKQGPESKEYADKLENHDNFLTKYHHDGDPTYVSFLFEVPDEFEEVYEHFR